MSLRQSATPAAIGTRRKIGFTRVAYLLATMKDLFPNSEQKEHCSKIWCKAASTLALAENSRECLFLFSWQFVQIRLA